MPAIGDLTGVIAPNEIITFTKTDLGPITTTTLGGVLINIISDISDVVTCQIPVFVVKLPSSILMIY